MEEIPTRFHELYNQVTTDHDDKSYEDHMILRINDFECSDRDIFDSLRKFIDVVHKSEIGKCLLSGEIRRDIELNSLHYDLVKDEILTLVVNKTPDEGFYYFLTLQGLTNAFTKSDFTSGATCVWMAEAFISFSTARTDFRQWGSKIPKLSQFEWQGLTDPRELVRDLSASDDYCVPQDIRPWLLRPSQKPGDSVVLNDWKIAAAKNLALALPSEVRRSADETKVTFKGEKIREVSFNPENTDYLSLFPILHECASWTFMNLQESDTKHALLNYHLAFEWATDHDWPNAIFIERALISARESYKLHLQQSSKELLKAFAEIKKSLHEEVNRVSQNTRGLITSFWRDFTIAAAVLVLKFLTDSSNLSEIGIKILYTATSTFLLLSLIITLGINARFHRIAKENRDKWYQRLYPFIDETSLYDLVDKPISKGLITYRWVAAITFLIYLTMSLYLMNLAYSWF